MIAAVVGRSSRVVGCDCVVLWLWCPKRPRATLREKRLDRGRQSRNTKTLLR